MRVTAEGNIIVTSREEKAAARKVAKQMKLPIGNYKGIVTILCQTYSKTSECYNRINYEVIGPCPNFFE